VILPHSGFRIEEHSEFKREYKIGDVLQKMFPKKWEGPSVIRSIAHGLTTHENQSGIIIAEHDIVPDQRANRIGEENYHQKRPWTNNEFLGNQYWVFENLIFAFLNFSFEEVLNYFKLTFFIIGTIFQIV
jgi:hypothetical protein